MDSIKIIKHQIKDFDYGTNLPAHIATYLNKQITERLGQDPKSLQGFADVLKEDCDAKGHTRFTWYIRIFQAIISREIDSTTNLSRCQSEKIALEWIESGYSAESHTAFKIAVAAGQFKVADRILSKHDFEPKKTEEMLGVLVGLERRSFDKIDKTFVKEALDWLNSKDENTLKDRIDQNTVAILRMLEVGVPEEDSWKTIKEELKKTTERITKIWIEKEIDRPDQPHLQYFATRIVEDLISLNNLEGLQNTLKILKEKLPAKQWNQFKAKSKELAEHEWPMNLMLEKSSAFQNYLKSYKPFHLIHIQSRISLDSCIKQGRTGWIEKCYQTNQLQAITIFKKFGFQDIDIENAKRLAVLCNTLEELTSSNEGGVFLSHGVKNTQKIKGVTKSRLFSAAYKTSHLPSRKKIFAEMKTTLEKIALVGLVGGQPKPKKRSIQIL